MRGNEGNVMSLFKDIDTDLERNISWKCLFTGHSFKSGSNDGGYGICDKCGMHQYYDNEPDIRAFPRMDDYPIQEWVFRPVRRLVDNIKWKIRSWDFLGSKEHDDLPF